MIGITVSHLIGRLYITRDRLHRAALYYVPMAQIYITIAWLAFVKALWVYVARPLELWCRKRLGDLPYLSNSSPDDLAPITLEDDRDLGYYRHER